MSKAGAVERLAAVPFEPVEKGWIAPTGIFLSLLGLAVHGVNRLLMRALFRLRIAGSEALPLHGPYVLVANHASDLDPLLLAAALSYRRLRHIYWGGEATRLFSQRWQQPLMRALHVFPLDEREPARGLALARAVLQRGDALVWFPEAWRSPDGALQRFLPGIGWLLVQTRVPVLPVYIAGSFVALPRGRRWPRPGPVRISVGRPLLPKNLSEVLAGAASPHQRLADLLRAAVAELGAASTSSELRR